MRLTSDDAKEMQDRVKAACAKGQNIVTPEVMPVPKGVRSVKQMNRTEAAYDLVLAARMRAGEVVWYEYEGITLKLAPDCRYTPDFAVMLADGTIEMHECKGFMREDALVKLKVAAENFPFPILLVKRKGAGWDIKRVGRDE